ncbi:MAG TPA: hypothetical protein VE990_03960 [Acidimicrobiales bacterium]|nr:hypothetical protein [Acidimicrobiales bacterium]
MEEYYRQGWLDEVSMPEAYVRMAALSRHVADVHGELARPDEVRFVVDHADGKAWRFRCVVEQAEPHRIVLQVFSPAMPRASYFERLIERAGRCVHVRDFGGDSPPCSSGTAPASTPRLGTP